MTKFSVVIITKNEEHNIERCIKSCLPLNTEIILLDSQSTDKTVPLAKGLGAQVHQVEWKGYGATKNYGAELAQFEWILSLDADEELNQGLQESLQAFTKDQTAVAGYWIRRSLVFNNKKLHYGALRYERRIRLYNKSRLQWNQKSVHEDLDPINSDNEWGYGELQGCLLHYSYKDMDDMKSRLDNYARLSSKRLSTKNVISLRLKRYFNPIISFCKNYFFNMGLLDGSNGYAFAYEQAVYVAKKYKYALEEKNNYHSFKKG